ncbi:MAG: DUF805 domain-containing protein [Succinivibrionaceae bacterium]|nr:DUF805 domain-containing protein [Succinivibrionaceae bacterium]
MRALAKRYASLHGRAGRTEFWLFSVIMLIVFNVIIPILYTIIAKLQAAAPIVGFLLFAATAILYLACIAPCFSLAVRRLHDINRGISLGWIALNLAPVAVVTGLLLTANSQSFGYIGYLLAAGATISGGLCLGLFQILSGLLVSALLLISGNVSALLSIVCYIALAIIYARPGSVGPNRYGDPNPLTPQETALRPPQKKSGNVPPAPDPSPVPTERPHVNPAQTRDELTQATQVRPYESRMTEVKPNEKPVSQTSDVQSGSREASVTQTDHEQNTAVRNSLSPAGCGAENRIGKNEKEAEQSGAYVQSASDLAQSARADETARDGIASLKACDDVRADGPKLLESDSARRSDRTGHKHSLREVSELLAGSDVRFDELTRSIGHTVALAAITTDQELIYCNTAGDALYRPDGNGGLLYPGVAFKIMLKLSDGSSFDIFYAVETDRPHEFMAGITSEILDRYAVTILKDLYARFPYVFNLKLYENAPTRYVYSLSRGKDFYCLTTTSGDDALYIRPEGKIMAGGAYSDIKRLIDPEA